MLLGGFIQLRSARTQTENIFDLSKNSNIVIRRMLSDDVTMLAKLHAEAFERYNTTVMGRSYLKGLYHTLATDPACISIVAIDDGKIIGWIGGVKDWLAYEKALIRNCMHRLPVILLSVLRNRPQLVMKAFPVLRRRLSNLLGGSKDNSTGGNNRPASRPAALLVIAVAPWRQNRGIGQLIMGDFHDRLLVEGFTESAANTFVNNIAGNRAFMKAGYELVGTHDNVNYYIKDLS